MLLQTFWKIIFCYSVFQVIPSILSAYLHLNEITPEEAQKYFAEQNLDLTYSKKLGEVPLAVLRSEAANREFYFNGRKIENPEDYVEETYEAEQFHGQDGLGRAMFGYTDHNQARLEARNANGDVRGSYQFVDPDGENVIVSNLIEYFMEIFLLKILNYRFNIGLIHWVSIKQTIAQK